MIIRILGAIFVFFSCGGFGIRIAAGYRNSIKEMRQLIGILTMMESELAYRRLPLEPLCRSLSTKCSGSISVALLHLADALERNNEPDAAECVHYAIAETKIMPELVKDGFKILGVTLGMFDAEEQIKQIRFAKSECLNLLQIYTQTKQPHIQSCQTLGLCAGAAMAILLM